MQQLFTNNNQIDQDFLAASLRKVMEVGPGKTARVPLLAGATNSGKSTVLDQTRYVFGEGGVLNKPKIGVSCPISRLAKGKARFIYFDDYRPVDYAALPPQNPTIPSTLLLAMLCGQPFDVTVSQSFNDGHPEMEWHRGIALTALEEGLWDPKPGVSREEIRHMQSRVLQFRATHSIPEEDFEDAPKCPESWCRWVVTGSVAYARRQGPAAPLSRGRPRL